MAVMSDARVLLQLARGLPGGRSHADALERFYGPQAARYDAFRERLLHGRERLTSLLPCRTHGRMVELGGGTGRNLEFFGPRLDALGRVEVVDLCAPLLAVARTRLRGRPNVHLVTADACTYQPSTPVDCVYFSYALTMIPDWRAAVDNALAMLKPGGTLGVVDFYVSAARPPEGRVRHPWATRAFWPRWFGHDGVHLDAEHLHALAARTEPVLCEERMAAVPYLPGLRAPYYLYIGRKSGRDAGRRTGHDFSRERAA